MVTYSRVAPQWNDICFGIEDAVTAVFNHNYEHAFPADGEEDDDGNEHVAIVELTQEARKKAIARQQFVRLVLVPEAVVRIVARVTGTRVHEVCRAKGAS